jgi:hypothetical protein
MIILFTVAITPVAFAQSSGSFSSATANTACTLNTSTGQIGSGLPGGTVISTTVQTPNSASTALDLRFSAVTGLFTETKVSNTVSTSTATAGLTIFATMDGQPIAPNQSCQNGPGCYLVDGVFQTGVVYDERFQQISQNFLSLIAGLVACTSTNTGTCDFSLVLSTLSAHSMDFVAPNVGQGNHNLKVSWAMTNSPATTNSSAAACIGPATLTVTQVKNFNQSAPICISSNGTC